MNNICYFLPDPGGGVGPPDVPSQAQARGSRVDLPTNAVVRGMSRGQSRSSMMETADGTELSVCVCVCIEEKEREKRETCICCVLH